MEKKPRREASKRQAIREQRIKKQRQQRLFVILGVVVVALLIVGFLVVPPLMAKSQPVGSIVSITPVARPQANGTAAGDPNAPGLVEVYADFQCPVCDEYSKTVEAQLMSNEIAGGKVYYVFRQFPIIDRGAANGESHQAANASLCAADQGRFWDYHDMLFANQTGENVGDFIDKRLVAFANALALDMNAFNACFNADRFKSTIDTDINAGTIAGVSGTPSVFVDGKEVSPGLLPAYADIQKAINAALAAKGK
jgi:protein-disulfide isomerase